MAQLNQQELPPVQAQLIISWHGGNIITFSYPTNIALSMLMIGETLKGIGAKCEFKSPSPIIQVPPGAKLVG